jgi:hypothetical protein
MTTYNLNTIPPNYHDTDSEQFKSWYSRNHGEVPEDMTQIKATDFRNILYIMFLNTNIRIIPESVLDKISELIEPTLNWFRIDLSSYDLEADFYYHPNPENINAYYSEENLEQSRQMEAPYEILIRKYVEFLNNEDKTFESVKNDMHDEYEMICGETEDIQITFEMMINALEQKIVSEFVYELFENNDDLNDEAIESVYLDIITNSDKKYISYYNNQTR